MKTWVSAALRISDEIRRQFFLGWRKEVDTLNKMFFITSKIASSRSIWPLMNSVNIPKCHHAVAVPLFNF